MKKLTAKEKKYLQYAAFGLGVFVVYKAFKKISTNVKNIFGDYSDEKELIQSINKEQQKLSRQGMSLSYPTFQYKSYAEILKNAMGGLGTDENSIYNVMSKMKNNLDLSELIKQYGTHIYAVSPIRFLYLDLSGWLTEELSTKELNKVNNILAENNITYKF